ncbi:MAG: cytochrome C oxidase subunit IV family protein [Bryobacterales bacterium]|nr:cytochrome C oxidase subunit IV family protein [Bryobacteraceae bacterium]MDW8353409.1 cytochrome C oxidase subunit IV family protein [Bryobacterales bacterium]
MVTHIEPKRVYLAVFAALMVLTVLTVWVSYFDMGDLSIVVALAIAVTKATLVVLFFMHARHSPRLTKFVIAAGFCWLVILIGLTLSDYFTRTWLPLPQGW